MTWGKPHSRGGRILTSIFAVKQFIFGQVIGGLSHRFERRPFLLTALVIMAFDYILMAVAETIWLLVIGGITRGITAAKQLTASAYIADISKLEDKRANFGLIGAAFGISFVLGPLMGRGYWRNTAHAHLSGPQRYWRGQCNIWVFFASRNNHRSY